MLDLDGYYVECVFTETNCWIITIGGIMQYRNFQAELKARMSQIDKEYAEPMIKVIGERMPVKAPPRLYNIYKRSLPPGIDKAVVIGVVKTEAEFWCEFVLKPKSYNNDSDDTKTLIYYDMLPQDATPQERNIYYNPKQIIK